MEITSATINDTARYTCVARNIAGERDRDYNVDVYVPPKIDESLVPLYNLSVITGRPVAIDCPADGIPPPEITWFKDGVELAPDQNQRDLRIVSRGRRLEINSADISDSAKYKCVAKNAAGQVDRQYQLHVWIPAKIETSDVISNPEVILNETITLFCPASGVPTPEVTWYWDDLPIVANSSSLYVLDGGWRLQIVKAQEEHTSRYTCYAHNIAGEAENTLTLMSL
jgi:hemicentin